MTRFWANRERCAHGRPLSAHTSTDSAWVRVGWEQRCVTPRQTCPRPNGLGRNLRSKTRWFTGFCNSHQVSHFATFFIDARAEISVAESRFVYSRQSCDIPVVRTPRTGRRQGTCISSFRFLGAIHAGGCSFGLEGTGPCLPPHPAAWGRRRHEAPRRGGDEGQGCRRTPSRCLLVTRSRVVLLCRFRQ